MCLHRILLNLGEQFCVHADFLQRQAVKSTTFVGACSFVINKGTRLSPSIFQPRPSGDGRFCIATRALFQMCVWRFDLLMWWDRPSGVGGSSSLSCSFCRKANTTLHLLWLIIPHDCTRSRLKLRLRPTTRYLQRDLCQSGRVAVGTGYMWAESSRQSSLQFLAKHWSNHKLEYRMQEGLYRECIRMNLRRSFIPLRNHNFWSL